MRRTVLDFAARQGASATQAAAAIRRFVVTRTASLLWQVAGFVDAYGNTETLPAVEVFQGVGFAARPASGRGEVIVVNVGGGQHPVAVACRDASIVPDLEEGETAVFNEHLIVLLKTGGTVEIKSRDGGTALALATKADLLALRAWVQIIMNAHTHPVGGVQPGAGSVVSGPISIPSDPPEVNGTSVLKGQ